MDFTGLGLAGLGFWLALGMVAIAFVWSGVKKQQMKHELTLKLLEKGQDVDAEVLTKLLAADKPAGAEKSRADKRREESGVGGFIFLVAGVMLAVVGILGTGSELVPAEGGAVTPSGLPLMLFKDSGPSWPLVGLGALCFIFGNLIFHSAQKEYLQDKAEEKAEANSRKD